MKIRLRTTGGVGGLLPPAAEVDTEALEPPLAERAARLLAPDAMAAAAGEPNEQMRDGQTYEVTLLPGAEGDDVRHYEVDQARAAPELMQLLHDLMAEAHRRRAGR